MIRIISILYLLLFTVACVSGCCSKPATHSHTRETSIVKVILVFPDNFRGPWKLREDSDLQDEIQTSVHGSVLYIRFTDAGVSSCRDVEMVADKINNVFVEYQSGYQIRVLDAEQFPDELACFFGFPAETKVLSGMITSYRQWNAAPPN